MIEEFNAIVKLERYIMFHIAQRGNRRDITEVIAIPRDQDDISDVDTIPSDAWGYEILEFYRVINIPETIDDAVRGKPRKIRDISFIDAIDITDKINDLNLAGNSLQLYQEHLSEGKEHPRVAQRRDGYKFTYDIEDGLPIFSTETKKRADIKPIDLKRGLEFIAKIV